MKPEAHEFPHNHQAMDPDDYTVRPSPPQTTSAFSDYESDRTYMKE